MSRPAVGGPGGMIRGVVILIGVQEPLGRYILRRLLVMIPTLVGIVVLSFVVIKLAPGDPTAQKFGDATGAGMNSRRGRSRRLSSSATSITSTTRCPFNSATS